VPVERLVLVHGSVRNGDFAWAGQSDLAAHFELVVLNRPGFPPNPPEERVDFEDHARWVAERLRPGDHLCGHSYGAVIALFAAALVRGLRSLTVIEPPAFGLDPDDPEVSHLSRRSLLRRTASSLFREDGVLSSKRYATSSRSDLPPNERFFRVQVTTSRTPKGSTRGF
jgi:pimeloyl-ACP methyl ester carboxylesterase